MRLKRGRAGFAQQTAAIRTNDLSDMQTSKTNTAKLESKSDLGKIEIDIANENGILYF
jgi:hypothetical protein